MTKQLIFELEGGLGQKEDSMCVCLLSMVSIYRNIQFQHTHPIVCLKQHIVLVKYQPCYDVHNFSVVRAWTQHYTIQKSFFGLERE